MTRNEFISRQKSLTRYGYIAAFVLLAGLAIFILCSYVLFGGNLYRTNPIFQICLTVYCFGGAACVVFLNIRRQKQIGACPKCGKRFHRDSAQVVIDTGKCGKCGETIIDG
jgi:hypothetical protein